MNKKKAIWIMEDLYIQSGDMSYKAIVDYLENADNTYRLSRSIITLLQHHNNAITEMRLEQLEKVLIFLWDYYLAEKLAGTFAGDMFESQVDRLYRSFMKVVEARKGYRTFKDNTSAGQLESASLVHKLHLYTFSK